MPKSRPPQDFGLNQDQLYDPEALAYWQQFTPEEFVHLAYHELINKQGVVMGFMAMLHDDPLFSKLPLTENYTLGDVTEVALSSSEEAVKFLDLFKAYFLAMLNPE